MIAGAVGREVIGAGVRLAVAEAGSRTRPAIVLVHGYPDCKEVWAPVMERLAGGFHVLAYDVRGAGSSEKPRGPAAYEVELLGRDLLAVIDALSPEQPVHLVGHDWGGIAGWSFAAMPALRGRLASFTSVAGPSLHQIGAHFRELLRSRRLGELARAAYRSWYVLVLCTPGGPTLAWRVLAAGGRWAWYLEHVQDLAPSPYHRRSSLPGDGLHPANLYRRNILRPTLAPRDQVTHVPVQLILPTQDHFISPAYYAGAEDHAPRLVRQAIEGTHWAPLATGEPLAGHIARFVEEVEAA